METLVVDSSYSSGYIALEHFDLSQSNWELDIARIAGLWLPVAAGIHPQPHPRPRPRPRPHPRPRSHPYLPPPPHPRPYTRRDLSPDVR